jgi:uncharacterized protein
MADVKLSRFIAEVPVEKYGATYISAFHTMTGAHIVVPQTDWAAIRNDPGQAPPGIVDALLRQGFLHGKVVDENAVLAAFRQQIVHDFSTIKTKTLVTRRCNNACTYCIVKAESHHMTHETALAVDRFCFELAKRKRPRQIEDLYSGGEVFLNPKILLESASRRRHFYQGCGIDYSLAIITNGTRITPAITSKLIEVGLTSIRVSIAGPAPVHNKLRPMRDVSKNGGNAYELIMKNLAAISDGKIAIQVQTQYDSTSDDYFQISEMLDDFSRYGIAVTKVSFTPIMARRDETTYKGMMGDPAKYLYLLNAADARGYRQFERPPWNACTADLRSRITFDTDGSITACASLQSGEMVYGHLDKGIDFVAEAQLLQRKYPDRCLNDCPLFPRCWGGCRLNALARGEGFDGIDCQEEVLWLMLEEYMKRQVLAVLSSGSAPTVMAAA